MTCIFGEIAGSVVFVVVSLEEVLILRCERFFLARFKRDGGNGRQVVSVHRFLAGTKRDGENGRQVVSAHRATIDLIMVSFNLTERKISHSQTISVAEARDGADRRTDIAFGAYCSTGITNRVSPFLCDTYEYSYHPRSIVAVLSVTNRKR